MCEVVVFTHSDYKDIWPIVCDSLQENLRQLSVGFAVNSNADTAILGSYKKYLYDDTKPYASRLLEAIQSLESDYILLFHDVDVMRTFDNERFLKLLNWIRQENVDRFYLGVLASKQHVCNVGDMPIGMSGLNICDWFTTPYDVGPSIWKRETLLELMKQFKDETYRSIESSGIQQALAKRNVYAFCKKDVSIDFTIGRPFTHWFSFCHILLRGQWIPQEAFQSHGDFFLEIPSKYKLDISQRGVAEFYHGWLSGFKIS